MTHPLSTEQQEEWRRTKAAIAAWAAKHGATWKQDLLLAWDTGEAMVSALAETGRMVKSQKGFLQCFDDKGQTR